MGRMYERLVSPVLDHLDSETWHTRAKNALHIAENSSASLHLIERIADRRGRFIDSRLTITLGGIVLENPVGVGAGWDDDGIAVAGLHALGFSFVEVGTVVSEPQLGNPKPRQFIIGPGISLNRMGFNSAGAEQVNQNLERYRFSRIPIGISIGKNKETLDSQAAEDYARVVETLYDHASYFAINVSSPNTEGLRKYQNSDMLSEIVQAVKETMGRKGEMKDLFIKIAPDLSNDDVDGVIQVVADENLTGIIATNTTNNPNVKAKYGERWRREAGGLSGNDEEYRKMATSKIAHIYKQTNGRVEIIGVGGVHDASSALEKIKAGARVVQIVTGLRSKGPSVANSTNREIERYLKQEGISNLTEIIGSEADKY